MDLDELVARIRRFPWMFRSQRRAFIEELVAIHPTLNVEWGPGWPFRRVRRLKKHEIPERVDDVIWKKRVPPKLGRANAEGFGVIYLSDRRDTALREARVERSSVAIADFEIRPHHTVRICPIGEFFQIIRRGRGFLLGDESKVLSDMLNACPLRDARSLVIADAFLYDQIVGQDNYKISSHVTGAMFKKLPHVSVIAYSSCRQLGAINFAVRTDTFWKDWGLRSVTRAFAEHLVLGFYKLSQITSVTGIWKSGRFEWEKDAREEESRDTLEPLYFPENI